MKIKKYQIRNYKAIADTEIKLNYSINPIIGVNESGKTSVLHAILAFDKNRDRVNLGRHLEYQNKYSNKDTKESKISAFIILDRQEIDDLKYELELKTGTSDFEEMEGLRRSDIFGQVLNFKYSS
jgi:predicted ATP-dependent endonuclease of OLD family